MRRFAGVMAVAALVVALPAAAQDAAPQTSLRPEPRPEDAALPAAPDIAAAAVLAPEVAAPEVSGSEATGPASTDPKADDETTGGGEKPVVPRPGKRDQLRQDGAGYAACLASLRDLSVVYEEVAAVVPDDDPDCGILQPLKVSQIAPGIALDPPAVIRCPTALALAVWVKDFVVPAAIRLDGRGAITAIENGSDYICRRRNNLADGALSEHAFGNAFDVMGFRFAQGPALTIGSLKSEDGLAKAFQDAIRAAACLDFTTVLGPGSNASHDNHLHLDIIARSKGYRLCELQGTLEQ
jgi:hypothetical protein